MKKYKTLIISIFITMLVLSVIVVGYNYFFGIKDSYILSSYVTISDKKGVVEGYTINYEDCKDDNDNFELEIEIGSDEKREIGFEISVLVNYEQQCFKIKNSTENILSKTVYVEENSEKVIIVLEKKFFQFNQNQFIINIRQDIEELSYKNELVRDSNTINFRYNIKYDEGEINKKTVEETHKNVIENPLDVVNDRITFEISNIGEVDDSLITLNSGSEKLLSVNIGGSKVAEDYIILAYVNSKQIKINGKEFCYLKVSKDMLANTNISIEIDQDVGIYELELYGIPAPFDEVDDRTDRIISAKRYTIKVES